MTKIKWFIPFILTACYQGKDADLIVHNAQIYSCDENMTIYEAMAIKDGKILELGPEREILNGYDCDNLFDAQMKPVYPGFYDAHCHFLAYAKTLQEVDLTNSSSFDEVCSRLTDYNAKSNPSWISGRGWDQTRWSSNTFPSKDTLDLLFPDKAVLIRRVDGHAGLANSKALELAQINEDTQIEGGIVELDSSGRLTGILLDNALDSALVRMPEITEEEKLRLLQDAEYKLFEQGLTSINDAGVLAADRDLMVKWYQRGELQIKTYMMLFPEEDNIRFASKNGVYQADNLHIRSFKIIADGAMGSWGACLLEPYHDDPHNHGFMVRTPEEMREIAELAVEIGYQVNTHAIGDSANRIMLRIYHDVVGGIPDHRWKIEHAQLVDSADFGYFKSDRIIPSVQPTHCTSDMRWAEKRLGPHRILYAYAWQKLLNQAGLLALGTDFPIENISPLETFYAAITRRDKEGFPETGFFPDQVLTREQALLGMTRWAAYSNFEENERGSLEPGKAADFVILTKDIMQIEPSEILKTFVEKTFLDGIEVFSVD